MIEPTEDPRAVANLMLDQADQVPVTNLALQKLLYFAHAMFLIDLKRPLVSGYFEAWQYGPVHPTAYQAFKRAGDRPITFRAKALNAATGEPVELALPDNVHVRRHVSRIMRMYGDLTPGRLVEIAHAKGAPWDFIVDQGRSSVAFGLRIPDDVIVDRFRFHKVSVSATPSLGEPGEDTPLT